MKLFNAVKKNLLLLIKSRASFLVIMLGPLLVILLAGLAFDNSNTYRIKVGVYQPNETLETQSLLSKLNTSQFVLSKFDGPDVCINSIYDGSIHACIIIPDGFT